MKPSDKSVSARTLRRSVNDIKRAIAAQATLTDKTIAAVDDRVVAMLRLQAAFRAEVGERLRVIEADIEKIQRNIGVLAKHSGVLRVPVLDEVRAAVFDSMAKGVRELHEQNLV